MSVDNYRYILKNYADGFYNENTGTVADGIASYTLSVDPSMPYIMIESDIGPYTGNITAVVKIDGTVVLDAVQMDLNTEYYFFEAYCIAHESIEVECSINSSTEGIYATIHDTYIIPSSPNSIEAVTSNTNNYRTLYPNSKLNISWTPPTGSLSTSGCYCIGLYINDNETPTVPSVLNVPKETVNGLEYIYI